MLWPISWPSIGANGGGGGYKMGGGLSRAAPPPPDPQICICTPGPPLTPIAAPPDPHLALILSAGLPQLLLGGGVLKMGGGLSCFPPPPL